VIKGDAQTAANAF